MQWEKRNMIYIPNRKFAWNQSHAQVPVVDKVNEKIWRIYYSTRTAENQSTTSFIEVEAGKPENVLYESEQPILSAGRLGAFDEHGIMPSCIIDRGSEKFLYYIGWSQKKSVPYQNSIGLAISRDGGRTFEKFSEGPLFGINTVDPFFTGTIFILPDGNLLRGYYLSCLEWKMVNGKPEPTYVLKYAESHDGITWKREGHVAIPFKDEDEGGLVSAAVVKQDGKYRMWFGCRKYFDFRENKTNSYRIGYAESNDGLTWKRDDAAAGIEPSVSGWDSEMISYPYVVEHNGQLFLFYNGNGFGRTGFGYAVSDKK